MTKADRAPERVDAVISRARSELAGTGLAEAPAVVVSAQRGTGLEALSLIHISRDHELTDAVTAALEEIR